MGAAREETKADERIAYRVSEVVNKLGIGKTTVYELIKSGELPAFKIGGATLVERRGLEALIERSRMTVG